MNSDMIKVLHCVGYMKKAGAETFIMNMYRRIDSEKIRFDFLCCENKTGDYDKEIRERGGTISYVDISTDNLGKICKYITRINRYKKAFAKYDQDTIIHVHGHHAFDILLIVLAAFFSRHKIIVHSHNSLAESHLKLHKVSRLILNCFWAKRVACSQLAGEWMFGRKKFSVIQNGIEVEKFVYSEENRKKSRKELGVGEKFVIGHVGRFEEQKNHDFLIELFYEFKKIRHDCVLMLVGEGILLPQIRKKVAKLGIQDSVKFLGVRSDVSKLYSAMDIFVLPSKYEGLGIVAVEAETSDLPCLFSSVLPNDIDITNKVIRCNLDSSIDEWIADLNDCYSSYLSENRNDNYKLICDKGFNVTDCSKKLAELYSSIQ